MSPKLALGVPCMSGLTQLPDWEDAEQHAASDRFSCNLYIFQHFNQGLAQHVTVQIAPAGQHAGCQPDIPGWICAGKPTAAEHKD